MYLILSYVSFLFFKQKTAYEMRISDWSSDLCSSDLKDPYVRYVDADIIKNSFKSSGGSGITSYAFGGATFRHNIYSGNATKMLAGDLKPLRGEIMRMEIGRESCRGRVCQSV